MGKYFLILFTVILLYTGYGYAQYKGGSYSGYYSVIDTNAIVGIIQLGTEAEDYALHQNYPNPFNPKTVINYEIRSPGIVTINVYDILGNEIARLLDERQSAGRYALTFDATNLPSGVYFYKLVTGSFTDTKKMLLTK